MSAQENIYEICLKEQRENIVREVKHNSPESINEPWCSRASSSSQFQITESQENRYSPRRRILTEQFCSHSWILSSHFLCQLGYFFYFLFRGEKRNQ